MVERIIQDVDFLRATGLDAARKLAVKATAKPDKKKKALGE